MNTLNGYSKSALTNNNVLTASGGHIPLELLYMLSHITPYRSSFELYDTLPMLLSGKLLGNNCLIVKAGENTAPHSKVYKITGYCSFASPETMNFTPGETICIESWIMRPSGATGTAGTYYLGINFRDKLGKPTNSNNGCIYFGEHFNWTCPCDGVWYRRYAEYTIPTTHASYDGSDGGGFFSGTVRCLINYNAGTIPTYYGGFRIYKKNVNIVATNAKILTNYFSSRPTTCDYLFGDGGLRSFKATNSMTTSKPPYDAHVLHFAWDNANKYESQLALSISSKTQLFIRSLNGTNWSDWVTLLGSNNYTNYVNTTNFPGLNKVGTVTSVTVTGANGLSGSGTVTSSGTITLSNAGVRATTINGNYLRVNTNGTNNDLTIPYATNADTVDDLHASDFVKITPERFSLYKKGIWTKILTFTITNNSIDPSISFSWHPTECARYVWADFNINIRLGAVIFMGNWKGSTIRTLKCVGDGTTYDVWVSGTKDLYDPYGAIQITSTYEINSYNTGSLAYQDAEPTGTYNANVSNTTIANYANSAGSVAWANVSGKPSFATVATSGSYNDLINKPTIPTSLPANGGTASKSEYLLCNALTSTAAFGLPHYGYTTLNEEFGTTGTDTTVYLQNYIKKLIKTHNSLSSRVGIGTIVPNSSHLALFRAYTLSDYNSTGLPLYCTGFSVDVGGYAYVWGTQNGTWFKHSLVSDKNIDNYYWANVKLSTSSNDETTPTFSTVTTKTKLTTPLVGSSGRLTLNATNTGLDLKFNNDNTKSVILNGTAFKPFDDANNKLTLGSNSARWSELYSVKGNFTGLVKINGTAASQPLLVRNVIGQDGTGSVVGELYLQYGANKAIMLGNTGAHSISADGSYYTGNAASAGSANTLNKQQLPGTKTNAADTVWCKFATLTFNDDAYSPVSGYLFFSARENTSDFIGILHYHFRANSDKTVLGGASLRWLVNTNLSIQVISVKTANNIYDLYVNNYSTWSTPVIHNMLTEGSFVWNVGSWTSKPTAVHTSTQSGIVNYANSAGNADTLDGVHATGLLTALSSNTTNAVSITVGGTTKTIAASTLKTSLGLGSNAYTSTAYLPLSGGTLTGSLTIDKNQFGSLVIYRNGSKNSASIQFKNESNVSLGYIGMNTVNKCLYRFSDDSLSSYTIWDSGNDGSGSGLDADLLDGTHKAGLFTSLTNVNTTVNPYSLSATIGGTTKFLLVKSFSLATLDIRDTTPTPNDVSDLVVTSWFNNQDRPEVGYWYSGITVAGWGSNYRVWLLASSSDQSDAETLLYFRTGRSDTWGAWRVVLDSNTYKDFINTTNFPGLNSVGDITGVTAGNGLTGGATSGTATLNVGLGTGITVNANDIAVKYGTTAGTACQGNDSRLSNARVNPNKLTIFGVEYDGSAEKTVIASTMIATLSEGTSNVTDNTEILTSYASNSGFADSNAPNILYKRDAICLYNYINTKLAGAHAGLDKVGTVTSVTVNGANGLSGSGTVTTSGTITLSNAGVRSTTINGNYLRVNTNGTNADLTIPYATNTDKVDGLHAQFNKLYYTSKSVTMSTVLTEWYIKIVLSAYAQPTLILIDGMYNNLIDRAIIEMSGMSCGYIYRNVNLNGGNIQAICYKTTHDDTEKKWIFWVKLRQIDNRSSHYSPSSSATYTVYLSNNFDTFDITATTTAPTNVTWDSVNSKNTAITLKNATLHGNASTATTASKLGSSTLGGTCQPIYLSSGTATAGTSYAKAIKSITRSGTTFTYTCLDGSTGTFTQQDNNSTYAVYGKTIDGSYKTAYRTLTKGNTTNGYYISAIRCNTASVSEAPQYGSGIAFGMADTHGYLYMNYSTANAYIGGGNADKLNWTATLLHSGNSSVSKSGQTLTVKINGVELSLTNTTYDILVNGSLAFTPAESSITNDTLNSSHLTKSVSIVRGSWSYAGNGYTPASTWGNIDLAGTTIIKVGGSSSGYTQLFITPNTASTNSALKGEMLYYIDNGDNYAPTWYRVATSANSSVSGGGSSWGSSITVKINGTSKTLTIPNAPSITATTTGSGNAITGVSASGHTITFTKGSTFLTAHQSLTNCLRSTAWVTNPGQDANNMTNNTMNFTYGNNAPYTGPIIYFAGASGGSYGMLMNATYSGQGNSLAFRTKNGDNSTWNSWYRLARADEIPSVGNGTVTITQGGTTKGSFTMNQSGDTTIALTDNNTDTKNTAGSTNTSSKIFLIGATSLAANPQTYSHDTAYVGTDGCLYSNSTKVSVDGHTHSYITSGGRLTCATTTNRATGLRFYEIYSNGYPFTYGNVILVNGANGVGLIACLWHGTGLAYRSAPDTSTTFTDWDTILTSTNSSVSGNGGSTWGSSITVKINGTSKTLTIPSNPNTHWTTRIYAGASETADNAVATNPYLKVTDDNTYRNLVRFVGGGATTVSSDASGNINISSTDTNTNYYHTRVYQSGLKISTGTGVSDMYVPSGTTSSLGVVKQHTADDCTTYTSDEGATTPAAVKKAITTFVSIARNLTSGTKIGTITIGDTDTDLYCQTNTDTDTKVTQVNTTTSANYRVLLSGTADNTDRTETARKSADLVFNPSTKSLIVPTVYCSNILTLNGINGVYIQYNGDNTKSLVLNGTAFKPFDTSNNKITLGSTNARWSNTYSVLGNFSGQITSSVATGTSPFSITSTTVNTNLNADMVDTYHIVVCKESDYNSSSKDSKTIYFVY